MAEMKRGNPNQKTLFQSWGKSKQQVLKTEESKNQNHSNNNLIEIIDLDDDDDDDGLLAAALEMESIDSQTTQENVKPRAGNVSNISEISVAPKEVEYLPGFDMESGNVWVYPTNYPIRDYQFEIVEKALFMNTLVTLPTGLGKTFIAAVLMYNYYRWYPQGKVIFMAPTKPLVAQQIEACFNIMGIPESDTAQMTGTTAPNKREEMWKNKRVFFLTPQVLQNDLSRGSCSAEDVVLLVFDEAHKALGNHAYSQVVREISNYTRNFRVLALSATPGDDIKSVQQVMTNLLISHMELRSEDSPDIQPYTHSRTIDKIVVPLGEDIARIKTHFLKVLEGIIGRLFCNRALWQKDPQRVTKYMLLNGRDQFRKRNLDGYTNGQKGAIEGDFAMAISLYHAYELLHQHGILSFYNFIKAIIDGSRGMVRAKTEIKRNSQFMDIMEELRESIECPPDETAETSALFSQFTSPRRRAMHKQAFDPSFKSHPKLLKLEEVIVEHFQKFSSTSTSTTNESAAETKPVNTRVMIFSQFRDSVGEITAILSKHKPLVRVMSFIGQATTSKTSRGLSQKEQLEVVQRFRKGGYNTLVATCVGEEGLDIGDVDLIVCFDAHASPIRLVQRMGRTGRKRNGRIVVLVSEGKEEQIYKRSLSNKKSIHKAIVQGSKSFELYDDNPRMIPRHLTPRVLKMQMTVGNFVGNNKKKRKSDTSERKSSNITSFLGKPGTSKSPNVSRKDDGFLTYEELIYWQENFKLPNCEAGTTPQNANRRRSRKSLTDPPVKELSLNEWMAWQNVPSQVYKIAHSRRTQHLIEILEFIELHGERDGGDDTYDVEMMTFLNEEDLLRPEDDAMILGDADYDGDNNDKVDNKTEKSKKKKKSENENDGEKKKNNNAEKQSKITKKSKKSKSISPQQKTKWREYLKGFENDDNDFDTGEVESKTLEEKQDNELTSYIDVVPHEILYENEESAELTEKVLPENNATEMEEEDDAFEVSSQNFSQLLPSLTPKKVNVLRTRITDVTENHAKDIPLPPSLDSLDEISPFTFDKNSASCDRENTPKFCREKIISCRRKINQFDEHKTADIGCEFGEKSRSGNKKLTKCLTATTLRKCDIEEPPDLDLELDFGNKMGGKWKHNDNASKKLTKNFSTISHKKDLIEDPPELDFENDFGEFSNEDENLMFENDEPLKINKSLRVKSQTRTNGFPKQTVPLIFGENEDDFQEKPSSQHTKPRDYSGFGAERNNVFPKQTDPMIFEENEDDFQEKASSQRSKPRDNSGFGAERNNVFPKQTDPMIFGENEDDFQEKASSQSTKPKDNSGFGVGVVCKNKNGVFDDDIEIEFGDDSLADGLFADLDEKEFERNCFSNQSKTGNIQGLSRETLRKSKDEREKNLHIDTQEDDNKVHGENSISRCETAPKKSKLKLNSKENSLCDNSLKNSILKLGAFERNAENSTKKPFNCFTKSEGIFDHSTHNRMGIEKSENTSEAHSNLPDNPGENPQRKEEFNFKKPDVFLGNRSIKSNRSATVSVKACKDTNNENGETISPVFTSSPLRKSLKLNSKATLKKQDNRELSSCSEFEEEKNSKLSKMQKNQKRSCSPFEEITSPCPSEKYSSSFDITHNEAQMKKYDAHNSDSDDSPILKKPLRERLVNHGLEDNVNNINSKCNQKDLGIVLNGEDSPVVTKKSKIRTLQNIAAISPLQGSQNSLRGSDSQEGESPVVRRRSKAKIRDGNVFAIAESDEEFEDDIQETSLQLIEDEVCNEGKAQEMDVNKIKGLRNRKLAGTSESEEDFLQENRKDHIQGADGHHQRKIVLQDSVKRKRLCSHPPAKKQKRLHANHFLDEEASLSGSDIDQFTDEESDRSASSEFDSFIDDSTQLTQRTPTQRTSRNPRSPMDMAALYRQSLMSPHARNLNFRTPSFRTDKNRYKMNFNPKRTGSESEAEETHAHESDLENELGFDNEEEYFEEEEYGEERWYGDENESPHNSVTKLSPQSQVQRPLNRAKRKYVLNDSVDEDIVACKRTPLKTSTKSNTPCGTLQSTQAFHHKKSNTLSAVPPKTNSFTASSSLLTKENTSVGKASASISSDRGAKWNFKDRRCIALTKTPDSSKKDGSNTRRRNSLSATFDFDWDSNGFSDSDLLEAVEDDDKNDFLPEAGSARNTSTSSTTAKFIQDHEMQDIAFAMAATDKELNLEMSEMPTFSLGLDFLGDDTEQQTAMKDNQKHHNHADLKKRMSTLTDPPFAFKQNLPQQNGSQESKFTKIVPPQRPGESNTRVFSFKSSSAATVKPFNKGIQNSTTNSQNIVKNISSSGTMCDSNDTSDGAKGSSSSDGHLIKPIGVSGNNSTAYTTTSTDRGKCQTNWCLDTSDRKRESTTSTPDSTPKNIPRAFVSPSRRDRDKLVILVDTKEICNAQVVSCLRRKHNIKAEVCQLIHCDYVVSNRVGVIRKLVSAVANGANATKLVDKMRLMCDLYDRPCLIIEKDRVKPGEKERDWSRSHAYSHTLACIAQTHIKVLFSESQEDTAALLTELASMEAKKKAAIQAPLTLNKETQQVFRFLLSIPRVSYITALNLCSSLRTLRDLISSTPDDLQKITKQLSLSRATEIYNYLKHNFDEGMTAKKKNP